MRVVTVLVARILGIEVVVLLSTEEIEVVVVKVGIALDDSRDIVEADTSLLRITVVLGVILPVGT